MPRSAAPLSLVLIAAACAKSEPPPPPPGPPAMVDVTATDYAFAMPDTLTSGATTFHLIDNGTEFHHIQLVRLDEGKTAADLQALAPGTNPPTWFHEVGGPNGVRPGGGESWSTVDLAPGNYVAICMIPSPSDNKPHFMKGMVHPFVVVPAAEKRVAAEAHFTLTLNDFSFTWSAPPPAGMHDIRVVNAGPQSHEVLIVRLDAGKKAEDLVTWFGAGMKGPPPGEPIGGVTAIAPGGENVIKVNLTPGTYGLYCFLEDVTDHKMHLEHGMVSQFTVQ